MTGLTEADVLRQREIHGANVSLQGKSTLWKVVIPVVTEPMFLLLVAACLLYALLGETPEAITMGIALIFVAGISIFQDLRSQRAVKALGRMTVGKARVLREGQPREIPMMDIVLGDLILCEEGMTIPADAEILTTNDLSINEALITGESAAVQKQAGAPLLQGTLAVSGYCTARVTAIGLNTTLAGIGLSGRRLGMLTMSVDEDNQAISALERRYLNRKIATLLGHMGGEWISLNDDLRKLHRALAQGASMVMLLDAWMPHFGRHVQLPFLGGRLSVPSGIARIARRTGARLVYCSAHEQGWRILGRLRPLSDAPDEALAQAVHYLESDIRDTPEQWWQWPSLERMWSPV